MHVFEVSVNGVPIVLDHPTANLALEGGGLNLTPPVRVFVLFPLDVVLGLDVSVKGAIVRETLWTQGALVGRARTLGEGNFLVSCFVRSPQFFRVFVSMSEFEVEMKLIVLLEQLVATEIASQVS